MRDPDAAQSTFPLDLSPIVLVADDERALLEIVRVVLRDDQFRVLTAADGQQALALAEAMVPEVLVTDVTMPGLDGFGLVRAVRRLYPGLPVIMISGNPHYGDRPVQEVAAEHGAFATLMKPFDIEDLRQAIQGALSPELVSTRSKAGNGVNRAA